MMAQKKEEVDAVSDLLKSVSISKTVGSNGDIQRPDSNHCCICQEQCVNPVQLPCSHVFCFLCIKGVAARNNHCALCRQRINPDVLSKPSVINRNEIRSTVERSSECHQWYYEARNGGWWLYEQRTSSEIEKAFKDEKESVRLQISGFYYVIDLKNLIQYREDFPSRRRQIKRDRVNSTEAVKGVAGIAVQEPTVEEDGNGSGSRKHDKVQASRGTNAMESSADPLAESSQEPEHQTRLVTGLD